MRDESISSVGYGQKLLRGILTLVVAFVLSATLLRLTPAWTVLEEELDPRYNAAALSELRQKRSEERSILRYFLTFPLQIVQGDLGVSQTYRRPITDLLKERWATTLGSVAAGLLAGWTIALTFAVSAVQERTGFAAAGAVFMSGAVLSCPSALLALFCLSFNLPPAVAIAAIVFSRVFTPALQQFREHSEAAPTFMARARGIYGFTLFRSCIWNASVPALLPVAGTSVSLAFGASIPVESLADSPGLGQLVWNAALGRDLPLLVILTLLLTVVSVSSNLLAEAPLHKSEAAH